MVMNQNCRTLVTVKLYKYLTSNNKDLYQGASQNEIKNRNTSNEYVQVWENR